MGVPRLWPFIKERFYYAVKHFNDINPNHFRKQFDYVYLDANGLLHAAAQLVFNYGDNKRTLNRFASLPYKTKIKKVFELFFDNIMRVVSIAIPTKVLYIAIDGPAPRAKQAQQRERRFISAIEQSKPCSNDVFTSSSITPGTKFMHELSKYMYWRIRKQIQHHKIFRNIQVIYSPPTVAGEGEHKIMDYIRSLSNKEKQTNTHCMFGPDGDLMMLTLAAPVRNIFLFREDIREPSYYHLVDMSKIKRSLPKALGQSDAVYKRLRTNNDVSNDFIFQGFFVGNDFLPKIKMFYRLEEGLDRMFEIYKETTKGGTTNFLTKGKDVCINGFKLFVKRLCTSEEKSIAAQATITAPRPEFVDKTLIKAAIIKESEDGMKFISSINMSAYRELYYNKAGVNGREGESEFESQVMSMCEQYFKSLVWVYLYYTSRLPSWGEAYGWHYAPLMSDLYRYLNSLQVRVSSQIINFELGEPALPLVQLLGVLPSQSNCLLPKEYRHLMTDKKSVLVKAGYYPDKFEIDYEGVLKEHMGVALLPFIDYALVKSAYQYIADRSEFKYHRNEPGKTALFSYNPQKLTEFTSAYGKIPRCKVEVKYEDPV